jgi:hypothetical protein
MTASVVALTALGARSSVLARLTAWDATYYADITRSGYPERIVEVGDQLTEGGRFAFSPLFPVLTAAVRVFGVEVRWAQVIVAGAAGIIASVAVHLLAREVAGSRRAGYVACALLGALPMAIVLQMGYAESLAIAFGALSLRATLRHHWWSAAGFALVAGLARPSGGLVALAIPLAAWTARRGRSVHWPRILGATLVGLLGLPLFWVYIWVRTGVVDGWFVVQSVGWNTRVDFGEETLQFLAGRLEEGNSVMAVGVVLTVVGYVVALLLAWRGRASAPLSFVSALAVALVVASTNFWHSKPRLLLSAFPLVALAAKPLARWRDGPLVALVVGTVGLSAWWGAYALTRWPYTI